MHVKSVRILQESTGDQQAKTQKRKHAKKIKYFLSQKALKKKKITNNKKVCILKAIHFKKEHLSKHLSKSQPRR